MATIAPVPAAAEDIIPSRQRVSLDEYLRTSYKPDCDYVDGFLEERNVGERTHGDVQGELYSRFRSHRTEWHAVPMLEQRLEVESGRFRVCDLAIAGTHQPREEVLVTPPLLCIEILSPEDRIPRAEVVLADYRAMGVAQSWLIDPIRRAAYTFDERGLLLVQSDRLELPGTPIFLNLPELFAELEPLEND